MKRPIKVSVAQLRKLIIEAKIGEIAWDEFTEDLSALARQAADIRSQIQDLEPIISVEKANLKALLGKINFAMKELYAARKALEPAME